MRAEEEAQKRHKLSQELDQTRAELNVFKEAKRKEDEWKAAELKAAADKAAEEKKKKDAEDKKKEEE